MAEQYMRIVLPNGTVYFLKDVDGDCYVIEVKWDEATFKFILRAYAFSYGECLTKEEYEDLLLIRELSK